MADVRESEGTVSLGAIGETPMAIRPSPQVVKQVRERLLASLKEETPACAIDRLYAESQVYRPRETRRDAIARLLRERSAARAPLIRVQQEDD